jgi:hypothetical protein
MVCNKVQRRKGCLTHTRACIRDTRRASSIRIRKITAAVKAIRACCRNKLGEAFITDLHLSWQEHGMKPSSGSFEINLQPISRSSHR